LLILTYLGYKLLLINPGDFASSTPLSNPNALFYSPISRIWEFLVGSVVFLFLQANSRKKRITTNPILKILICTVLILICSKLGLPELISVSSAIFIIYSDDLFAKPSKLNKALTWIGDKSYVIYLVHMPIIHIFHNSPLFVKFSTPFLNIVSVIIILLTTIVISSKWENQYRASGKFENTRIKGIIIMFIIIPFIILSVLRVGSITFFGFTKPPVLQGTILCENPGNYGECVKFNNNATGDLILIGDSHAAAVSKSVEDIAVNANKNFILMQGRGCQILPLEENEISNDVVYKKPRSCKEIVSNIFQLVKSKPNAQILLSQRSIVIQKDVEEIQKDRLDAAKKLATKFQSVVILKGSGTVIANPDNSLIINTTGNPALATAGTGDVLAGLCGSLLAQQWPIWDAALAAVWIHGYAADCMVNEGIGPIGITAPELLPYLRKSLNQLLLT
jgi:hypothetical protein